MKEKSVYVWKNNQIETIPINSELLYMETNCLMVDTRYPEHEVLGRYGKYVQGDDTENFYWEAVPFEYFPKEFKTQLLLLGII